MALMTVFVLAVAGAIVFAMRLDEDPSRWAAREPRTGGRHVATPELPATPAVQPGAAD